jgi:hypothetical protein
MEESEKERDMTFLCKCISSSRVDFSLFEEQRWQRNVMKEKRSLSLRRTWKVKHVAFIEDDH